MPSIFPGMDPYLEDPAFWKDFHGEFIYACRELLLDRLPSEYDASVEEQVRLIEVPPAHRAFPVAQDVYPDVAVLDALPSRAIGGSGGPLKREGGTATLDPVTIEVPAWQKAHERWVQIRYRPDDSLVTIIEVLSPTNKQGDGWNEYRAKHQAILRQDINLVEVDLLLGGRRLEEPKLLPAGDYYTLVSRTNMQGLCDVYAWPVRRPLPTVPVPLRPADGDVLLDLAAAFTTAFDRGRYGRRLRYAAPPPAPLPAADVAWAAGLGKQSA